MFYVKEQLNDAMEVSIEINDENVFCRCPHCGSEVRVDLAEVFAGGEGDFCPLRKLQQKADGR